MDTPLVSIVTPTHNSAATVRDTVRSVAAQSYCRLEHIIVDGASTDATESIIRSGPRTDIIKFRSEPDNGLYEAMNKGIVRANGDIIGILNSDDFYASEDVLSVVAEAFRENRDGVVYGGIEFVDRDDTSNVVRSWYPGPFSYGSFVRGWHPPHPAVFVARALYDEVGLFNTGYRIAADFDMLLRLFELTPARKVYLPRVLVRMRYGGASTGSVRNIIRGNVECFRAIRRNTGEAPFAYPARRIVPKLRQFLRRS